MRHLGSVSWAMVVGGVALLAAALLFDLGPTWALGGLLLAWAGIVKVVVVALWRGVASVHGPGLDEGKDGRGR